MNREENIKRFEGLMAGIQRPGIEQLMNYIRKSDFYTAPASTKYHLSCEGGLLQHSLNVFDALVMRMAPASGNEGYIFRVDGKDVVLYSRETLILAALLHDICKTNFYTTEMRNQKVYKPTGSKRDNGGKYDWEQVPAYAVEDRNPYGHGEKSVMMVDEFMRLTMEERYAIRWHMGMSEKENIQTYGKACEKYPLCFLLHNADQEATHYMEDNADNKPLFQEAKKTDPVQSDSSDDSEPVFQDAEPV